MDLEGLKVGFAITGSFCTIADALPQLEEIVRQGAHAIPIMSEIVYSTDTRFTKAKELIWQVEDITGEKIIHTICDAEPIGPKNFLTYLLLRRVPAIHCRNWQTVLTIRLLQWRQMRHRGYGNPDNPEIKRKIEY